MARTEAGLFVPNSAAAAVKQIVEKAREGSADELADDPKLASTLPQPMGYHILLALPEADEAFEGGILKADITRHHDEISTMVGFVLRMGPECYLDKVKFPSGPWCKQGDFVVVKAYSGTRLKIFGKEFRLITDDMVQAVVEDPRGISRV